MNLSDKLLVLRFSRLGRLPPAWNATELLAEAGLPVVVFEFCPEAQGFSEIAGDFERFRLGAPSWHQSLPSRARPLALLTTAFVFLVNTIRRGRPRLIIAHGLQEQVIALWLHRLFGIPYAVHVHEVYDSHEVQGLSRWLLGMEGNALRSAEFLIFPEKNRAALYRDRYRLKNRIHTVYNSPRLHQPDHAVRNLRAEWNLHSDHLIVGYMGGIGPANALEEWIEALPQVPKATAVLWGWSDTAYLKKLQQLAQQKGVANRVRFEAPTKDKWSVLGACDVLYCVYTDKLLRIRYAATASNKFGEALAAGVPVIAHAGGGFEEALKATQAGVSVPDIQPATLASAMQRLQDPTYRKELGQNGRAAFVRELHYEHQFRPVLTHVINLLNFQEKLRLVAS